MPEMGGADVVIVGGGIIGCATAYELAARGARVTLVERDQLAAGASGRNHGLLLVPLDPALVPMAAASTARYEELIPAAPMPVHLDPEPLGFLIVAATDEERPAAREEAEAASAGGVGVERVPRDRVRELEPSLAAELAEAWLLRDARRVDPAALTVALGLQAAREGATVLHHLSARSLLIRAGRVDGVVTDGGIVHAGTVVVAAGPWTPSLLRPLGVDLPVFGARGWLVHVSPPAPVLSRLVGRAGWHAVPGRDAMPPLLAGHLARRSPEAFVSPLLQPNPDGTLLLGGSRQWAITDEAQDPVVPREIVRAATALVPPVASAQVLSAWSGVRPMTPDGRPVIGFVAPNVVVATGHGSQGVILGGGTAALVASIVTGTAPPFDAAPFLPERLRQDSPAQPKLM